MNGSSHTPPTDLGTKLIALGLLAAMAAMTPAYYAALAVRVITR